MTKTSICMAIFTVACLGLTGCASNEEERYLQDAFSFKDVCLVDNQNVPASFFIAVRQAIEDKGLKVTTVRNYKDGEDLCPVTVSYEARYQKIPFTYLADAKLILTEKNRPTETVNLKKSELLVPLLDRPEDQVPAIRDMVNRLFPRSTPW